MNFAYDWAFAKPVRKVYYNLTITGLSVFVAVFIGAVELLGLLARDARLNGSLWSFLQDFNINTAGLVVVAVFVATWLVALAIWHFGHIEEKWDTRRPVPADSADLPDPHLVDQRPVHRGRLVVPGPGRDEPGIG
jgi:high-affinity nickel-transport protein